MNHVLKHAIKYRALTNREMNDILVFAPSKSTLGKSKIDFLQQTQCYDMPLQIYHYHSAHNNFADPNRLDKNLVLDTDVTYTATSYSR